MKIKHILPVLALASFAALFPSGAHAASSPISACGKGSCNWPEKWEQWAKDNDKKFVRIGNGKIEKVGSYPLDSGYYTQGSTITDDYIVYSALYNNNDLAKGKVIFINRKNGKEVATLNGQWGHMNAIWHNHNANDILVFSKIRDELFDSSSVTLESGCIRVKGDNAPRKKTGSCETTKVSHPGGQGLATQAAAVSGDYTLAGVSDLGKDRNQSVQNPPKFYYNENDNAILIYNGNTVEKILYIPSSTVNGELEGISIDNNGDVYISYNLGGSAVFYRILQEVVDVTVDFEKPAEEAGYLKKINKAKTDAEEAVSLANEAAAKAAEAEAALAEAKTAVNTAKSEKTEDAKETAEAKIKDAEEKAKAAKTKVKDAEEKATEAEKTAKEVLKRTEAAETKTLANETKNKAAEAISIADKAKKAANKVLEDTGKLTSDLDAIKVAQPTKKSWLHQDTAKKYCTKAWGGVWKADKKRCVNLPQNVTTVCLVYSNGDFTEIKSGEYKGKYRCSWGEFLSDSVTEDLEDRATAVCEATGGEWKTEGSLGKRCAGLAKSQKHNCAYIGGTFEEIPSKKDQYRCLWDGKIPSSGTEGGGNNGSGGGGNGSGGNNGENTGGNTGGNSGNTGGNSGNTGNGSGSNNIGYETYDTTAGKINPVCADTSGKYTAEQKALAGCEEKRSAGGVANFIINIVISLLEVGAVGAIIYGGFTYASSRGDPEKAKKGKQIILYAAIGMVVGLLSYAIVNFIIGGVG